MAARNEQLLKEIGALEGEICWGVDFSQSLNLSMNFGHPHLRRNASAIPKSSWSDFNLSALSLRPVSHTRHVRAEGQWWLWVYISYWSIRFEKHLLASGSSSLSRIHKVCADLDGQKLKEITVNRETGRTRFEFDLGSVLEIRRMERSSKDELWSLSCPNDYALKVYGDGTYTYGKSCQNEGLHYLIPEQIGKSKGLRCIFPCSGAVT